MQLDVVTIFPEYFAPLSLSLIGKARNSGLVNLNVHDLRDWAADRHRTVDDTPYGGGAGMVMMAEPWAASLDTLCLSGPPPRLIVPSPAGRRFDQRLAAELAAEPRLVFACGRYEGIDARFTEYAREHVPVDEVSLGDFILNGGEVAAIAMIEAIVRLLPGVLGNADSLTEESHGEGLSGLLEYPVYTKPSSWRGREVPSVLRSGHHEEVARWRALQALSRTLDRRPDLIPALDPEQLTAPEEALLEQAGWRVDAYSGRFLPGVRPDMAD